MLKLCQSASSASLLAAQSEPLQALVLLLILCSQAWHSCCSGKLPPRETGWLSLTLDDQAQMLPTSKDILEDPIWGGLLQFLFTSSLLFSLFIVILMNITCLLFCLLWSPPLRLSYLHSFIPRTVHSVWQSRKYSVSICAMNIHASFWSGKAQVFFL